MAGNRPIAMIDGTVMIGDPSGCADLEEENVELLCERVITAIGHADQANPKGAINHE